MDTLFSLAFVAVAPIWVLLVIGPRWSLGRRLVTEPWLYAPLAVVYVVLVAGDLTEFVSVFSAPELGTVAGFVATERGVTIGWVHWLVFDAFLGRWMTLDADERRTPHLLVVPCLLLTLFAGPTGFLAYLLVRTFLPSYPESRAAVPG